MRLPALVLLLAGYAARPTLPTPTLSAPQVGYEAIRLRWTLAEFAPAIVERKTEHGAWERIADGIDDTEYDDKTVEPATHYSYRVFVKTAAGVGPPSNEVAARSKSLWAFAVITASPGRDDEPGQAYMEITKVERRLGVVSIKHLYKAGDPIGTWDGTTKHRIAVSAGRSVEVDFGSRAMLKSVKSVKQAVQYRKCVPQFTRAGVRSGCQIVAAAREMTSLHVTYLDDTGAEQRVFLPPLLAEDEYCEEHRPKK